MACVALEGEGKVTISIAQQAAAPLGGFQDSSSQRPSKNIMLLLKRKRGIWGRGTWRWFHFTTCWELLDCLFSEEQMKAVSPVFCMPEDALQEQTRSPSCLTEKRCLPSCHGLTARRSSLKLLLYFFKCVYVTVVEQNFGLGFVTS